MTPDTPDRPPARTDDDQRPPSRTAGGLATAAVIAVVLLVVAAPLVPGVVAQEDQPTVPASYYGDVTVNGEDAEPGTEIVALVDGEERGSIGISEAGSYGGPGALDDKLVVEGSDDDNGTAVTFEIRGVEADRTVTWTSGDVRAVDLTFENVPESDDSGDDTEEEDAGGGGGGAAPAPADGTEEPGESTETPADGETTPDPDEEIDGVEDVTGTEVVSQSQANISTDPETGVPEATFDADSPVQAVEFESGSGAPEGSVEVTEVSDPPAETGDPPGASTTVADIQVPDGAADDPATVTMRVSDERLAELDAGAEDLRIHRYADGEWQPLETSVAAETDTGVVLAADTPGFSFFAASAVSEPDAELSLSSDAVAPDTTVTLDGTGSEDPYGEIVAYNWSVGGEALTGETASLAFTDSGEYTVELAVTNDAGETASLAFTDSGEYTVELAVTNDAGETDTATTTLVVSDPDSGGDGQDTAAASEGDDASGASDTGSDGTVSRETFGSVPSVWILGIGAVFVAVVLGLTVVLRRNDSSRERL